MIFILSVRTSSFLQLAMLIEHRNKSNSPVKVLIFIINAYFCVHIVTIIYF